MSRPSKIPWSRLMAEFAVIVAGVTVALLADEWREARRDRALEQELIERLVSDVAWDIEQADVVLASAERVVQASSGLLALIDDPLRHLYARRDIAMDVDLDTPTDDPGEAFFTTSVALREFGHRRYTYDEMLATGTIRVVTNADLREQLSRYYGDVESDVAWVTGSGENGLDAAMRSLGLSDGTLPFVDDPMIYLEQIDNLAFLLRDRRNLASFRAMVTRYIREQASALRTALLAACDVCPE